MINFYFSYSQVPVKDVLYKEHKKLPIQKIYGGLRGRMGLERKLFRGLNDCIAHDPRLSSFGS